MKILMKEIVLIRTDTDINGIIYPLKFKVETEEKSLVTYTISHIQDRDEEPRVINKVKIFRCEAFAEDDRETIKIIELKYDVNTCKWYLYKM